MQKRLWLVLILSCVLAAPVLMAADNTAVELFDAARATATSRRSSG